MNNDIREKVKAIVEPYWLGPICADDEQEQRWRSRLDALLKEGTS